MHDNPPAFWANAGINLIDLLSSSQSNLAVNIEACMGPVAPVNNLLDKVLIVINCLLRRSGKISSFKKNGLEILK